MINSYFYKKIILRIILFKFLVCPLISLAFAAEFQEGRIDDPWELHRIYGDLHASVCVKKDTPPNKTEHIFPIQQQWDLWYMSVIFEPSDRSSNLRRISFSDDCNEIEPGNYNVSIRASHEKDKGGPLTVFTGTRKIISKHKKTVGQLLIEPDTEYTFNLKYDGNYIDYDYDASPLNTIYKKHGRSK